MSTHPLYVFEHAPSGTLLRAHHASRSIQLLRRDDSGRYLPLGSFDAHPNRAVSHVDGKVLFHVSDGWTFELGADDPGATKQGVNPEICALVDRERGLVIGSRDFPYEAPDRSRHTGLLVVRLDNGEVVSTWGGLDGAVKTIDIFPCEFPREPYEDFSDDLFEVVRGADSWALVAGQRVAMVRGGEVIARVEWHGEEVYPSTGAFDDVRGRLLISGRPGIVALAPDGEVVASWSGVLPGAPCGFDGQPIAAEIISPPCVEGDEILVVIREPVATQDFGSPSWQRVIRLDADSLQPLGDHAIGRMRDSGEQAALLRLADGSLAWFPRTACPRILPAEGVFLRTTDHVDVVGEERASLFEEPDADWYDMTIGRGGLTSEQVPLADAGQRRSLARYLLEHRLADPLWHALLLRDPHAFEPFADSIVTLPDGPLAALRDAERRVVPWTALGASDDAVEGLVARIRGHLDGASLPDLTRFRVRMLAQVGTPSALQRAAELGRSDPRIAAVLRAELVDVPAEGPAELRYDVDALDVYAVRERGRSGDGAPPATGGLSTGETFGRGKRCALPLMVVLRVDESLVEGGWAFFLSRCEACDEMAEERYDFDADLRLEGMDPEPECSGDADEYDQPMRLLAGSWGEFESLGGRPQHAARLGGRPEWWQHPAPASCECGRLMHYVGCAFASAFRDDVPDVALYGFRCACGRRAQVSQMT